MVDVLTFIQLIIYLDQQSTETAGNAPDVAESAMTRKVLAQAASGHQGTWLFPAYSMRTTCTRDHLEINKTLSIKE